MVLFPLQRWLQYNEFLAFFQYPFIQLRYFHFFLILRLRLALFLIFHYNGIKSAKEEGA